MNKERYERCKRLIEDGRWEIDLEKGTVKGKRGCMGNSAGDDYLIMCVHENGRHYYFKVHEIIAIAGGLIPLDITIDHINGDRLDNRFCNLQLLSNEDNISKAHKGKQISDEMKKKIGEAQRGSKHNLAKLTEEQVAEIKMMLMDGKLTQVCIAWLYGVNKTTITAIKKGRIWGHVKIEDYI